jgi:ankyrin repeat protein
MLFWLKRSAELGYQPALMFGRRAFEANSQEVPGIFPPGPPEFQFQTSNNVQIFSQMVRTAWLQSLRDKVLGILGSPFNAPSFPVSRENHIYEAFRKHAYPQDHRFPAGYQQVHILAVMGWQMELEEIMNGNPALGAATTAQSETPLLLACKAGQLKVVQWLLRNGSDPSLGDREGLCPLHFLFAFSPEDWEEAALSLLTAGALVNEKPAQKTRLLLEPVLLELSGSPSRWAALTRNPSILRFLLAHGAEFEEALFWIGRQLVCPETLRITVPLVQARGLTIYGASLYGGLGEASTEYMTHSLLTVWLIHGAWTYQAYADCVDLLRSFNFPEWVLGDPDTTAVQWAARRRDLYLLDVLLSRGFMLTSPNTSTFVDGFAQSVFNPLYEIQSEDDILPVLEVLDKHGVLTSQPPTAPTYNLLKYALAINVRPDIVLPFLLEHGYRATGADSRGQTALHYAVSLEAIRPLMEHGAGLHLNTANTDPEPCNPEYPPCCGLYTHECFTPLFHAISSGKSYDLVREFLIQGATEVMPGKHFRTVFHQAIILQIDDQDPAKMVSLLLTFEKCLGVINNVDYQGATALQYAVVLGKPELVRLLAQAAGASLQTSNYVPPPQELAHHFLNFPPWFVIPGDFPEAVKCPNSEKYNCTRHTCNISIYREKLLEIKKFLDAKGTHRNPSIA